MICAPEMPQGGSTGLSHEHTPIRDAVAWLAEQHTEQEPLDELKQLFGLLPSELGEICAFAAEIRVKQFKLNLAIEASNLDE